ncbi:MAG TPA: (5-formylfuran-3-yl)methyl phosphate synthase [Pirellulaceae bacterium]|nr:(5-formylfuran-3-yl)methyl phosphate synthase [Pirellulaceae bacterium]HMO93157.1 (5-formylfuran-3-yl)methyl phosphate synthase [Pirellulaceae bacterium]HMP70014.1 (5-formylfuran-3-yl)methyl phosphate synthase [Pirellulaceae bacterium]
MTRMIVSVNNCQEAIIAQLAGADHIDLQGSQDSNSGATDAKIAVDVAQNPLLKTTTLSLSLGELTEIEPSCDFSFAHGFSYARVGLANTGAVSWREKLVEIQAGLPIGTELVAAFYTDHITCGAPDFWSVLKFSFVHDVPAIVFDVSAQSHGSLIDYCSLLELKDHMQACESAAVKSVLAGGLNLGQLNLVHQLQPDFVALREPICYPHGSGSINPVAVGDWKAKLVARRAISHSTQNSVATVSMDP